MSTDPHQLNRFLEAQATTYAQARSELTAGRKRSHWMWFIFPQIHGLGSSPMAQRFAITGLDEAAAYLAHPTLGLRLRECTALVNAVPNRPLDDILGYPDDLKFHSSVTLFAEVVSRDLLPTAGNEVFAEALQKYFRDQPDHATLSRLT